MSAGAGGTAGIWQCPNCGEYVAYCGPLHVCGQPGAPARSDGDAGGHCTPYPSGGGGPGGDYVGWIGGLGDGSMSRGMGGGGTSPQPLTTDHIATIALEAAEAAVALLKSEGLLKPQEPPGMTPEMLIAGREAAFRGGGVTAIFEAMWRAWQAGQKEGG